MSPLRPPLAAVAASLAIAFSAWPVAAQPFHLEDSLRGATVGNARGGSFGAEGWTVTGVSDGIWYELPRLESGSVEFTVANITPSVLVLPDHEFFAMYEAGYGMTEPITYAPYFRSNHYKIMLRVYGEAKRLGFLKMMWGICPGGAPGYTEGPCACESYFAEPFADPGPWTGAPVRIRVEWGGGRARVLRDGAEVVGVDWSGTGLVFGPETLHMMLGSPRNDGGLSSIPMGATFSDLVVDGNTGPLATCPGTPVPDAGVPPPDAGACDGGALAIADGTAASWEPGVFPDEADLNVEGDGAAPSAIAYMRFPAVSGTAVTSATLTTTVSTVTSAGGGSGVVCRAEGAWDEATLTWATRPTVTTACVGSARTVSAGEVLAWDVTSLIVPGVENTLALVSTDPDGSHYLSRESGCAGGPRLAVATVGGGTDGGGSTTSDGGPGGGDEDASTTGRPGVDPDAGAGCGCRVTGARDRAPAPLALAALVVVIGAESVRRRRRR